MMRREEAAKMLAAEKTAQWEQHALEAVGRLPGSLRPIAYALLDRDAEGRPFTLHRQDDWARRTRVWHEGHLRLGALTAQERRAVFTAIIPGIAPAATAAWDLLATMPYQSGGFRRAYRLRQAGGTTPAQEAWIVQLVNVAREYPDKDSAWFAAWAPYLGHGYGGQQLGILLAAAIDAGGAEGEEVFQILLASARGEHAVGAMGRHVTSALLAAARPEGWEFVERLLLAAQREEGLRQVILEAVDEAHPEAFRRMLHLILEHDLIRFSAVVRAADVWFGLDWDVDHARAVKEGLALAARLLDDPQARRDALHSTADPAPYLALWATAFRDAEAAAGEASTLLTAADPARRLLATYFIGQLRLDSGKSLLLPLLDDPDLRVALCAFAWSAPQQFGPYGHLENPDALPPDLFERLERLLSRLDGQTMAEPESVQWPWERTQAQREMVARALLPALGSRSPKRLIPYMRVMEDYARVETAKKLAALAPRDREAHDAIFGLASDRSSWVRSSALEIVGQQSLEPDDAPRLEAMLTRKSADMRRSVITLLLKQKDEAALASAGRLLAAKHPLQRLAGLDVLGELAGAGRSVARCRACGEEFRARRLAASALSGDEETRLGALLASQGESAETPTLDNALGLIAPHDRTEPVQPHTRQVSINTAAARACLAGLDALVESHHTTPVIVSTWQGKSEMLLGDLGWQFPSPSDGISVAAEDDARENLPLAELWRRWEAERPPETRDADGLELIRAIVMMSGTRAEGSAGLRGMLASALSGHTDQDGEMFFSLSVDSTDAVGETFAGLGAGQWLSSVAASVRGALGSAPGTPPPLRHHRAVQEVLTWLVYLHDPLPAGAIDVLLDGMEATFASIPRRLMEQEQASLARQEHDWRVGQWRESIAADGTVSLLQHLARWRPEQWSSAHHARYWSLLHWLDRPHPGLPRRLPDLEATLTAFQAGAATEADILDHLAASAATRQGYWAQRNALASVTGRAPHPLCAQYPVLQRLVAALRERILRVELTRGEMPTPATALALSLRYAGGASLFVRLVAALEPTDLRAYAADNEGRAKVFSHLLRATFPDADDTHDGFAALVREARLPARRLVAAAVYAPQWGQYVERYLDWPHLEDAIWWTHAHTKDSRWDVDQALKDVWQAEMSERTPLGAQDLLDGAVDVDWFLRIYQGLGAERWEEVYAAAKYASSGTGHARARVFADAMTGKLTAADLGRRISDKRNQDAVRALGLVPLPGEATRSTDVAARYSTIQEFVRGSKKFGAQRRANEAAAARIGLENLARTAGYPDPIRLQWAMEAHLAADLRTGATTVTAGDVEVTLALDPLTAEPAIVVAKAGGRLLRALPARLKKDAQVVALTERKRELARQVSRMRASLEAAMCRGDRFEAREIAELLEHPLLARLLRNLVFVQERAGRTTVLGYPAVSGEAGAAGLQFHGVGGAVTRVDVGAGDLRLAHPYDLFADGAWPDWQHDCFASERIQPFKQVFRELYLLTANESRHGDDAISGRYAGHQIQPQQAMALLGARGWVTHPEEGVRRTFHAEGLSASVTFDLGYFTPAEVEGLTIEGVQFTRRGEWKPIPLAAVPPRVFSEAMRDLDLVVSVAHRGGVDPEATASTVEMRAALVRETCGLLGLDNVEIASAHAVVRGGLGDYSIHLGSAVVHRQPGGALCIVPVHSQHRGRIFLPFSDDDPRTAEVVSKVVLLARDRDIKDPSILEQILA